jgi:hypothetical protein
MLSGVAVLAASFVVFIINGMRVGTLSISLDEVEAAARDQRGPQAGRGAG